MNFRNLLLCAAICLPFVGAACQRAAQTETAAGNLKEFEFAGTVVSVDQMNRKAKIEHDAVKNPDGSVYMQPMEMNFTFKQNWVIRELQPNQKIAATLIIENGDYYLDQVQIMQTSAQPAGRSQPQIEPGAEKVGVEVPNFQLVNQDNKKFGFNDLRGKNVVVTFIFTRCPDAEMCPLMSINFSDLARELEKYQDLSVSTKLLSVTFDPKHDTPKVLRDYGVGYFGKDAKPNFELWQLATGSESEIKNMTDFFGVTASKADEDRIVHNLRTAIISPTGKIVKIYPGNAWKNQDIVRELMNLRG